MARYHSIPFLFLACLGLGSGGAEAAAVLTARDSLLTANYLLGAGPTVRSDTVEDSETSLSDRTSLAIQGNDDLSGILLGQPWSAAISFSAEHQFSIEEVGGNLLALNSSGFSTATASSTGGASVVIHVRNPGNRLELHFTIDTPTAYVFQGAVADSNTISTGASVAIERFNGSVWVGLRDNILRDTSFVRQGELDPGLYRFVAEASARAQSDVSLATSSWNTTLSFAPVPLPPASGLFGSAIAGLFSLARANRKSRNQR